MSYLADAWEGSYDKRTYRRDIDVEVDPENPGFWVARYAGHEVRMRAPWRAEAKMHAWISEQLLEDNTETPLEEPECEEPSFSRSASPPIRLLSLTESESFAAPAAPTPPRSEPGT